MATAMVEVPPPDIVGFDKQANVFIAEITVSPSEKKTVPIFVLNSSDFINLQLYLQAGLKLPRSQDAFTSTYPKQAFDTYLGKDAELYNALKTELPVIHEHCSNFQGETIGPMINIGGYISNFAEDAKGYHREIAEGLEVICSPNTKKGDTAVDDAKARVRNDLRKLNKQAQSTQEECVQLVTQLSKFKTVTSTDQEVLTKLVKRFNDAIPSQTEREKTLHGLIQKSKDTMKALSDQAEQTHNEAIERGKDKWYYYIPIVGACILIYDRIKQKGLLDTLNDLKRRFNDEQAKGSLEELQLTKAFNQVNSLSGALMDVDRTIQGAIDAVEQMKTAFSTLASSFKRLRDRLEDVDGDIDEKGMEALVAKEDLKKAASTWEDIQGLAKQFQMYGVVLKPPENDDILKQ